MPTYESLLSDAAQLPIADRLQLIDAIWDTLPEGAPPPLSREWIDELDRRSAEFDSGAVETVPWEQIRTEALRRAGVTVPNDAR